MEPQQLKYTNDWTLIQTEEGDVITLQSIHGAKAHIEIDDGCFVLMLENEPGIKKSAAWWFPEAMDAFVESWVDMTGIASVEQMKKEKAIAIIKSLSPFEIQELFKDSVPVLKFPSLTPEQVERLKSSLESCWNPTILPDSSGMGVINLEECVAFLRTLPLEDRTKVVTEICPELMESINEINQKLADWKGELVEKEE